MFTFYRLLQARLEKEESEEELKELQERVSTMKKQTPDPGHTQTLNQVQSTHSKLYMITNAQVNDNKISPSYIVHIVVQELQRCSADLQKAKSELEKHRTEFDRKVMEVISIKKSHQNQEAELKYEIDRMKGQLHRAKEEVAKAQEKSKRVSLISE